MTTMNDTQWASKIMKNMPMMQEMMGSPGLGMSNPIENEKMERLERTIRTLTQPLSMPERALPPPPDMGQATGLGGRTSRYNTGMQSPVNQNMYNHVPYAHQYMAGTSDTMLHLAKELNLSFKSVNDVWSIYGMRGSGKSYFLGKMCEELNRVNVPFVIFDVLNAHKDMELPNVTRIHMRSITTKQLIHRLGAGESFIVSLKGTDINEQRTYVAEFSERLNMIREGFGPAYGHPVMVAFEECHNFIGQHRSDGSKDVRDSCFSTVEKLIREGRQDGIGIVMVSQNIAAVNTGARRQASIKIIFRVMDSTDIEALRKTLVGKTRADVQEVINNVFYFNVGEFVCVAPSYITNDGIVIDRTGERKTQHAGRSFIEGDSMGIPSNMGNYSPSEIVPDLPGDGMDIEESPDDDVIETYSSTDASGAKLINYKHAITVSLAVLSAIGILFVVFKKYMDKRELEREQLMDEKLRTEQQKIQAINHVNNQNADSKTTDNGTGTNSADGGYTAPNGANLTPPDIMNEWFYDPYNGSSPFSD